MRGVSDGVRGVGEWAVWCVRGVGVAYSLGVPAGHLSCTSLDLIVG